MHQFEIWAPLAASLSVQISDQRLPMSGPDDNGWWHLAVESSDHGDDYGFLIDEKTKVFPDPRSMWQPHGVHGPSRIYKQDVFRWSDQGFRAVPLASAIIYELHVGTFTPEG